MEIKSMEKSDLHTCIETFVKVFNDEPWNDEWTFAKAQKYLLDFYRTPGFSGVLAVENGEVLGFIIGVHKAWWSGNEFFIHEMCVDTQHQNKGIGKALLHALIESFDEEVSNVALLTDRGIPAESFYRKNGFEAIERIVFLSKDL